NWRLDLVRLVIDGQSEGHGVTPNDLSTKPGQPQERWNGEGRGVGARRGFWRFSKIGLVCFPIIPAGQGIFLL
uniref:hypothetical protein n=1 Tax=Cyanobium sp. TaxID=2164130 RepID=UPI0040470967